MRDRHGPGSASASKPPPKAFVAKTIDVDAADPVQSAVAELTGGVMADVEVMDLADGAPSTVQT